MGISIDIHIYDADTLQAKLKTWGATDPELSRKILEACGTFAGDKYILLNNEYGDGYSPYFNVASLFDAAFKLEDSFDIFLDSDNEYSKDGISYVDEYEVAEELGITPSDDED